MERKIIGIDNGTSNGMLALKEGKDAPIQYPHLPSDCPHGMPMLFMYDKNGKEWVGDQVAAKNGLIEEPQAVCQSVKMKLDEERILLNGRVFTPKYISVKIVKRLLELSRQCFAQSFVDMEYDTVVAGVPAGFTAAARGEVREIIQEATGCTDVRLIDEASAAALANHRAKNRPGMPNRNTLTVDLGAGTTDVVMLIPNSGGSQPFRCENPKGINVAGDALDDAMAEVVMEKLRHDPGTLNMAVMENKNHYAPRRMRIQCRQAKESLSRIDSCTMEISDYNGGYSRITVTRDEYEDAIRPLLKKMVDLAESVLNSCNLGERPDIDILLVGGTSNIPLLQKMMRERFPWVSPDCFTPHLPDKAVAMGAVIYGEQYNSVTTKSSYGYAIEILTDNNTKRKLKVVIPPNAKLPSCRVDSGFATAYPDQDSCALHVYEVSQGFTDQILELGAGTPTDYLLNHQFPCAVPAGTSITLTANLTKSGTLTLTSRDKIPGGKVCEKSFTLSNVMAEEEKTPGETFEFENEIRRKYNEIFCGGSV